MLNLLSSARLLVDAHSTLVGCMKALNLLLSGLHSFKERRVLVSHMSLCFQELVNFFLESLGTFLSSFQLILPDLLLLAELISVA